MPTRRDDRHRGRPAHARSPTSRPRRRHATMARRAVRARRASAYVRLNMITTLTGAASGSDGTSDTLTSRTDRDHARRDPRAPPMSWWSARRACAPRATSSRAPPGSRSSRRRATSSGHRLSSRRAPSPDRVLIVCARSRRPTRCRADAATHGVQVVPVPGDERIARPRRSSRRCARARPSAGRVRGRPGARDAVRRRPASIDEILRHRRARRSSRRGSRSCDWPSEPDTDVAGMLVDEAGFSYLRLRARR